MDVATLSLKIDSTDVGTATNKMNALTNAGGGVVSMLAKIAGAAGFALLARQMFDTNVEFQRLQSSLVTVTGSTEDAARAFAQIQGFAEQTPYEVAELTQAFIDLNTRGMDAGIGSMTSYGNMASAFGRSLTDLVRAVSGVAMGESEAIKSFGVQAMTQGDRISLTFKGQTEVIKRTVGDVEAYFKRLSDANFAGGMERQAKTLGGVLSNLKDQIAATLYTIGESGASGEMIAAIRGITSEINEATPAMAKFLDAGVAGTADLVRGLYENRDAIIFLGGLYASSKIGSSLDAMTVSTKMWIAAKREAIGQSLIAKDFAIAEAESHRLVAVAAAQNAAVQARLAAMDANTAPVAKQIAARKAQEASIRQATAAIDAQIAAEARLAAATGAAGAGAKVLGMLGGPIGIITTLLGIGVTAWALWGDSAKDAGQKAHDAMDKAEGRTKDAIKELQGQVHLLKERERLLEGKGQSSGVVGDQRFSNAEEATLVRVRQALDAIKSAEMGIDAIENNERRFKSLNDKIHAEQALYGVISRSKNTLEDLARLEGDRVQTQARIKGMEFNPRDEKAAEQAAKDRETYRKTVIGLNTELDKERILMEQGATAAYRFGLATQGIHKSDIDALTAKKTSNDMIKTAIDLDKKLIDGRLKLKEADPPYAQSILQRMQDAARITDQFLTPKQAFEKDKAYYNTLNLDIETYKRAIKSIDPVWTDTFGSMARTLDDFSMRGTDAFVDFCFTGKAQFSDLITSMLRDLARLTVQKNVMGPLFDLIAAGINGAWSTPTTTAQTTFNPGPITSIPASAGFSGMQSSPMSAPIIVNVSSDGQSSVQGGNADMGKLGRIIGAKVREVLVEESRQGGLMARG